MPAAATNSITNGHGSVLPEALLLVDDNELNRQHLAGRLARHGYRTTAVASGEEAMDCLRRGRYDLILLDTMMPEWSGPDVLKTLKADRSTRDIPVIMISGMDEVESVAQCINLGAEDYVSSPFDPVLLAARIHACLESKRLREQEARFLQQLQKEKQHSDQLVNVVIPIGISLLQEKNLDRLLETILLEAKALSHADGGTLYLRTEDNRLRFVMLRNDSLKIEMGGPSGQPIPFPPLNLYLPDTGEPNHSQVACHVALTGKSVNIPDAYDAAGFNFSGTKAFDSKTGYRSKSFLTSPLKNKQERVIGVLQLINAINPEIKTVIPFDPALQQAIESLSLLAAAALEIYEARNKAI
jgi:CheY-like chemotaxis protein